jgi:hypothetical protein
MSVPGIQLDSAPYFSYFQPNVRQYLQGIKEAVISGNLPEAQQAFDRLNSLVPASPDPASGRTTELTNQITLGLQTLGNALDGGELPAARQAVEDLSQSFQSISHVQAGQQANAPAEPALPTGTDGSGGESESSSSGPVLNVVA